MIRKNSNRGLNYSLLTDLIIHRGWSVQVELDMGTAWSITLMRRFPFTLLGPKIGQTYFCNTEKVSGNDIPERQAVWNFLHGYAVEDLKTLMKKVYAAVDELVPMMELEGETLDEYEERIMSKF
ncbi:MAG: hypothetical protein UU12_C0035G0004 [Candidatus Woesebacteria bacterium GW2011_GWA2_40_7b]|uniref:Uncharacterized protein n=1 Tax=Candidatus Woesebacteria bacterium GW2011_GWA2_40_7b TaxID=1618563 RepID=A0A0G0T577_9BACT|nr:MAG: hypothetical protein UU12_C0035G0004 [Candidatus Woesebacteria bacterium GW2011_GWA2_40_7b]